MLPPEAYLEARRTAESHVQVEILAVDFQPEHRRARLTTRVCQSWRGPRRKGEMFDFYVPCAFPGQEVAIGGTLWFSSDALRAGIVMEGFFNGNTAARDQIFPVTCARWRPWFNTRTY